MSLAAFTLFLVHLATYGVTKNADEGASARIWQVLMLGQAPIMAVYFLRGVSTDPAATLKVLALQITVAIALIAPLAWLER
jgi:hypothetical protein